MARTEYLNNGRIRFANSDFITAEIVILSKHMRFLAGDRRIFPKGGIARAYACADQLEETAARYPLLVPRETEPTNI